jgi:hypothetical protein
VPQTALTALSLRSRLLALWDHLTALWLPLVLLDLSRPLTLLDLTDLLDQ